MDNKYVPYSELLDQWVKNNKKSVCELVQKTRCKYTWITHICDKTNVNPYVPLLHRFFQQTDKKIYKQSHNNLSYAYNLFSNTPFGKLREIFGETYSLARIERTVDTLQRYVCYNCLQISGGMKIKTLDNDVQTLTLMNKDE